MIDIGMIKEVTESLSHDLSRGLDRLETIFNLTEAKDPKDDTLAELKGEIVVLTEQRETLRKELNTVCLERGELRREVNRLHSLHLLTPRDQSPPIEGRDPQLAEAWDLLKEARENATGKVEDCIAAAVQSVIVYLERKAP